VNLSRVERDDAQRLVHRAHEVLPYSNATRNNVDVRISKRLVKHIRSAVLPPRLE
jgi:organic hydroperoxide reductase OsmC/OhrA